jgi:hypothetical protein
MKHFVKKLNVIICICIILLVLPYELPIVNNIKLAEAASVKLNKTNINIGVGETYQLNITGTKSKVKWSTSNKSIAIVSSGGLVTGKKSGTVIITAKISGDEYECTVNIVVPFIYTKLFVNGIGGKTQYTVKNLSKEYKAEDVYWKTSDENVFTVDDNGLVTSTGLGNAKLTAVFGSNKLTKAIYVIATKQNLQDAADGFKIEYSEINNQIVCVITNNSKIDITAEYQLEFYDAANNLVSISTIGYLNLFKGDEYVAAFSVPEKGYNYYKIKYDKLNQYIHQINRKDKVSVEISDKYDYTYQYNDGSDFTHTQVKDTIKLFDININNQSGKRVYFEAYLLYYKDDLLTDFRKMMGYNDLDVGVTTIEKVPLNHTFINGKIILPEYDTCRIIYSAKTNKY